MRVLAIESATIGIGAALIDLEGVVATRKGLVGDLSAEALHMLVLEVLAEGSIAVDDLEGIAVDIGPGLFTGLRVGVASAKVLAVALALPIVGIGSLEALLIGGSPELPRIAVIDMRRGEVAFASSEAPEERYLDRPERCVEWLRAQSGLVGATAVGDGWDRYSTCFGSIAHDLGLHIDTTARYADPGLVGLLGAARLRAGQDDGAAELLPIYLREADAKANWTMRTPKVAIDSPEAEGGL